MGKGNNRIIVLITTIGIALVFTIIIFGILLNKLSTKVEELTNLNEAYYECFTNIDQEINRLDANDKILEARDSILVDWVYDIQFRKK